jgi:hypothetical protein
MTNVALTLDPDELVGLRALVQLGRAAGGDQAGSGTVPGGEAAVVRDADTMGTARDLLRAALADELQAAGLPWNPSADQVHYRAAKAARSPGAIGRLLTNDKFRRSGLSLLAVAALVALWGGYIRGWSWTGFRSNEQVWDWLHLLLLPVVLGTIPLWIEHPDYIGRTRRIVYIAVILAWTGFVLAGYLVPLKWTGFPGNTLWDWFGLIVLPVAVMSVRAWPALGGKVAAYHKAIIAVLGVAWVITLIGGYGHGWKWTGYPGNTLWDWLQLLLAPLALSVILIPATIKFVSGDAEGRAKAAPVRARARREPPGMSPAGGQLP